jgi:hypothetical protein
MTLILLFSVVLALYVASDIFDVTLTVKGIKAGVAVEGNLFLLSTNRPTARALYLRDTAELGMSLIPAVIFFLVHNTPLLYAGAVCPAVMAVKHVLGGLAWKKLL